MDKYNVNYFSKSDIRQFLCRNSENINSKQGRELLTGLLLSELIDAQGKELRVGYRLKKVTPQRENYPGKRVDELLANPKEIDDRDIDIFLDDVDKNFEYKFQVTRLVPTSVGGKQRKDLYALLDRKMKVPVDKDLKLVISIEDDFKEKVANITAHLDHGRVPYGAIYVIGKVIAADWKFMCCQVWPKLSESSLIDLSALLIGREP